MPTKKTYEPKKTAAPGGLLPKEGDAKRGRLSNLEMDYIRNNLKEKGAEAVAKELNRTVETVKEFAKKEAIVYDEYIPNASFEANALANRLKETPEWEVIREEFTEKECKYFLYMYGKYMSQFKDDVLPTEENQIFQAIKFELLMRRNLLTVKKTKQDIRRLEEEIIKLINKYEGQDMPDATRNLINNLENQILSMRTSNGARTNEFVKLGEKHSALFKELKATRDQRVSKAENSAKDIFSLLKQMQDPRFREKEGRQQALVKLATEKEKQRLGEYHTYEDGGLDRQILSPNTVGEED